MKRRWTILLTVAAVFVIMTIAAWRIYRHETPSGTDFYPY